MYQNSALYRYDSDRDRSELLAKERLLDRQGHKLIRTTSKLPDISELQVSGGVNIRENIVAELELRHHLEREVGCYFSDNDTNILFLPSALSVFNENYTSH